MQKSAVKNVSVALMQSSAAINATVDVPIKKLTELTAARRIILPVAVEFFINI